MEKFLFMKQAINLISQGIVFKKIYAIILRIAAVVTGFIGLFLWISGWQGIFSLAQYSANKVGIILGGALVELLMIVLFYAIIHALWIRAKDVEALPESGYAIIPIMSLSLKLTGEIYACLLVFIGLASGLFMWFAGSGFNQIFNNRFAALPYAGTVGNDFLNGLITILSGLGAAFAALFFFYFLAEAVIILVDIVNTLKEKK